MIFQMELRAFVPSVNPSTFWHHSSISHRRHHPSFMFTGIVEDMGTILQLEERDDIPSWDGSGISSGTVMTIQTSSDVILDQSAYVGCSISVSGVCLTVTSFDSATQQFTVGLAPETLRKTYFGSTKNGKLIGSKVNLERASEIGLRNSGHFVQGHVDDVGTIVDRVADGDSLVFRVQVQPHLMSYIVPKGFIAIDGTSLTVIDTEVESCTFTFMLIQYTQKKIIVPMKQIGELVNIEVDVLAKYSEATIRQSVLPRLDALEGKVKELEAELASYKKSL
jgi:riboflavin synthase